MTNTPLVQLVLLHRYFWYRVKGIKDNVPKLVIGIADLHPTAQPEIPGDYDSALNRKSDISFSDRSRQEEAVLILMSDYVGLISALERATPFLRRHIGSRLRLRRVPELDFRFDESVAHQDRIEQVLRDLREEEAQRAAEHDSAATEDTDGHDHHNR